MPIFSFFLDDNMEGFDGIPIGALSEETDSSEQVELSVDRFAAGDYFVYAQIQDGDNPPVYAYADSAISYSQAADLAVVLDAGPTFVAGQPVTVKATIENQGSRGSQDVVGILVFAKWCFDRRCQREF